MSDLSYASDWLRWKHEFSRPFPKRDKQFNVIYVTQSKTALRNKKTNSFKAQIISVVFFTTTVEFFFPGLFSLFRDLLRQAHEQEAHGLVNAAQSNNLSRLIEILDANPERVPFFFHSLLLQMAFASLKNFWNQGNTINTNIRWELCNLGFSKQRYRKR